MGRTLLDTIGQLVAWTDSHLPEIEPPGPSTTPGTRPNRLTRVDRNPAESQAERDERLRHGSSFGEVAAAYAEYRPDYADAAIRWALEPVAATPAAPARRPGSGNRQADRLPRPPGRGCYRRGARPADAGRAKAGDAWGTCRYRATPRKSRCPTAASTPSSPASRCTGSTWTARYPRLPVSLPRAVCWPGCGTSMTTGSAGSRNWPRSASESPASRCSAGVGGVPQTPVGNASSRPVRASSALAQEVRVRARAADGPPIRSWRPSPPTPISW